MQTLLPIETINCGNSIPPSPCLSSTSAKMMIDKFSISSKVKELATYIATVIRKKRAALNSHLTINNNNNSNNNNAATTTITNPKNEDNNNNNAVLFSPITSATQQATTTTTTTTTSNPTSTPPPSYLTRATPPGLVSAASILLAAQLEGIPLKSMTEICSSTGLNEDTLQSYYKDLVAHVTQLLPPNYVPSSKVWIYLKTGIDQGYIPSPLLSPISHSVAASPSLSLSPLSLTPRHSNHSLPPDMAAIQMDSNSPSSKDTPQQKISSVKESSTPNTPNLHTIQQPYLILPPSPIFIPRRGSVQVISPLDQNSTASNNANPQSRRASIGPITPVSSPSMKKIAVQIDSNNFSPPELSLNPWQTVPSSDSAIAAVIASLSSSVDIPTKESEKKIASEQKHTVITLSQPMIPSDPLPFRKFTRRFSSQNNHTIQLPPPIASAERRSSLGRRGSTTANEDAYSMSSSKRSRMGINQLLNSSSSSSSTSLPISPIRDSESDSSDY